MDFEAIMNMMRAETTPIVKYWMRWMMFIFFASLAFIPRFKPARWAAAAIPATIGLAALTWLIFKNVHLFGIPHLIVWTPLAVYLWKRVLSPAPEPPRLQACMAKPTEFGPCSSSLQS